MGLDVYLYHYKNFNQSQELEKEYQDYSDEIYEKFKMIDPDFSKETSDRVRQLCQEKAAELGLDEYGDDAGGKTRIEQDSVIHPDHYFKIGYFRSSYNGSGINGVLQNLGIYGLYEIFNPDDRYCFNPDWNHALQMVNESIEALKKDKGFRILTVSPNLFDQDNVPGDPLSALNIFQEEEKKNSKNKNFLCYSNRHGEFYLDKKGLTVHGMIPGKDFFGRPCTYIVYKDLEGKKYMLQSLEIVKETIEFVLAQNNPQEYFLHWSS